jgi:hypothetical protein
MTAVARWRALSRDEQWLVVRAAMSVATMSAGVRLFRLRRMLRSSAPRAVPAAGVAIHDYVTAVDRAGRYVPGATCLAKSLALARMLRKNGVAANVRIGVKAAGAFEAHAWVEVNGVSLQSAASSWQKLSVDP